MATELTPEEIEALLAAYAINAVDDEERVAIEQYLETDPAAAAEVAELRRAAAMLAYTASEPVPDHVWDAIAPQLQARRDPEAASVDAYRARASHLPARRRWATRRVAVAAGAVAIAAAVAIGIVVAESGGGGSPSQSALAAAARAARRSPGAREAVLGGADGRPLASAVIRKDGTGYLSAELPTLPNTRTYQLWALAGTERTSLGVIGSHPRIVAFRISGDPSAIAVTNETAGGVKTSRKAPVAVGDIESL